MTTDQAIEQEIQALKQQLAAKGSDIPRSSPANGFGRSGGGRRIATQTYFES